MQEPVSMLSLATAVPPHLLEQSDVAQRIEATFARFFDRNPQLRDVFVNSGIERRYSVRPIEWLEQAHDWGERASAYLDGASDLFVTVATEALAQAGLEAADIDIVISVTSSGIATPTLEARAGPQLGFKPTVCRVPLFGLGCAGGATGLALATKLARAHPGQRVLLVVVELCTLAYRRDRAAKIDVVASALFGDGAAAAVLQAQADDPAAIRLGTAAEHTWPETLDIMGWTVDPVGLGVVMSRALPQFIEKRLAVPAMAFMAAAGLNGGTRFICHPGGAKVLAAIEIALGLDDGTLTHERAVLRDYGNMSAPTLLFVLQRALEGGLTGPVALAALGPGFTASFLSAEAGHG
jgi:alkylresorcinol/alkylpyrone synthase